MNKRVLISSGCHKNHLIGLAGLLDKNKSLETFLLCSLYPKENLQKRILFFLKDLNL